MRSLSSEASLFPLKLFPLHRSRPLLFTTPEGHPGVPHPLHAARPEHGVLSPSLIRRSVRSDHPPFAEPDPAQRIGWCGDGEVGGENGHPPPCVEFCGNMAEIRS